MAPSRNSSAFADLALFVGALVLGALAAASLMPSLVRNAPTEVARIPHLLSALNDEDPTPEVVVLGNSIAMCGVDAKTLSAGLAGTPLAYNLASTGQTALEAQLFAQALPDSVEEVILFVTHRELVTGDTLDASKYNAFYLGGLEASAENRAAFVEAYPDLAPLLAENAFEQRFRGRWAIRRLIDGGMRQLLRRDLALERANRDLFFPQPYTKRLSDEKREQAIARFLEREAELGDRVNEERAWLIDRLVRGLVASDRRVLVVSPPVHPSIRAARSAAIPPDTRDFLASLDTITGAAWLDASTLLDDNAYIDDVHPTSEGAALLTGRIADAMGAR